jgi:hypothetical protein
MGVDLGGHSSIFTPHASEMKKRGAEVSEERIRCANENTNYNFTRGAPPLGSFIFPPFVTFSPYKYSASRKTLYRAVSHLSDFPFPTCCHTTPPMQKRTPQEKIETAQITKKKGPRESEHILAFLARKWPNSGRHPQSRFQMRGDHKLLWGSFCFGGRNGKDR